MIYITCITKEKKSLNYEDVTSKWVSEAKPNSYKVKELNKYVHDGTSYKIDGKNVILDYSNEEKEVAKWLVKTFGGEIYMCPRINSPEGISTPDYLFRGEGWDLKTIKGCGKNVIDSAIMKKKQQALNFIIDITKSELTICEIMLQISKIYNNKYRSWVKSIILKKGGSVVGIYIRKRD